jgi:AraC family transcriptional regulator of adaptative response/methylated-DNA-[protein]-cysteine methyltransferase
MADASPIVTANASGSGHGGAPTLEVARIESPLGPIGLAATPQGLTDLTFRIGSLEDYARCVARLYRGAAEPSAALERRVGAALAAYFSGRPAEIPGLDLGHGSAFQQRVWRALRAIGPGETRSYAWVARAIGAPAAARAVGAACGANPVPIFIPCHRVVRTDGALGGYSYGIGIKRRLLRLENARLTAS